MKSLRSWIAFLSLLFLLFVSTSCEKHPASETLSVNDREKTEEQKGGVEQKLAPAPKPPQFFHQAGSLPKPPGQ